MSPRLALKLPTVHGATYFKFTTAPTSLRIGLGCSTGQESYKTGGMNLKDLSPKTDLMTFPLAASSLGGGPERGKATLTVHCHHPSER